VSLAGALFGRSVVEATCAVDIEKTADSFHAYTVPEDIEIRPGDQMLVHDVPTAIAFGDQFTMTCRATVTRAGWLERLWTKCAAFAELTELYEVGFQPKETPCKT
jgi:hypothetical protein